MAMVLSAVVDLFKNIRVPLLRPKMCYREVGGQIDVTTENWLRAPSGIFIDNQVDRLYIATPPILLLEAKGQSEF